MLDLQATHGIQNILGALKRDWQGNFRKQQRKLLPAYATRYIAPANMALQQETHASQYRIARVVAEGVVEALEMIDVQHDDR
jgi:hypothetical protein